jgi:nucleoside-diphosphate-sugar epimerase
MRFAITGGAGFVGGHLTEQLRAAGHEVTVFTRQSPAGDLTGYDVLIHAAWDFANPGGNVADSVRLFDAAKAAGTPHLLFISSLSAFEGCRSQYGATKLAVEKHVAALGGRSVRLGFVCDDTDRGLSGGLKKLAALPLIPLPGGGTQILFAIQAEDLGHSFLSILKSPACGEPVNLAHPDPISLKRMMRIFSEEQGKRAIFLPFPWRFLWLPLRFVEALGLRLKFRSDSLVSLMNQAPQPHFGKLREWRIDLHPFGGPPVLK